MAKQRNISMIRALMILSQVLLTAFVSWWLVGQYKEEKASLEKDLYQQFTESKQQVMDSMLFIHLIDPMLKDKKGFRVNVEINDSFPHEDVYEQRIIMKRTPGSTKDSIITVNNYGKPLELHHPEDSASDALLHGVKLFIKEVTADTTRKMRMNETFYYSTDTLLLKKVLSENLEKKGLLFPIQWIAGKRDSLKRNTSTLYFESNLFPKAYGAEISHYNFYLMKRITPQFLFAIILLLMTGGAFLISFRSLKNQVRLNTLKNDFISNISHELKTPVTTVKIAIEALQHPDLKNEPEKAQEYLDMASLEADRLDMLINKVLNTSMAEEGKQLFQLERINLAELVEEVLQSLQLRFSNLNATVNFNKQTNDLYVNGDRLHVQGVITNLIDNSLKYASENPEINISLSRENKDCILSISDNGPGIPEEYMDKVFDKFFRVPTGNRHNIKGYGLGLSYAALVMKHHNGNLTVKNNPDKGCTFTITFPSAEA